MAFKDIYHDEDFLLVSQILNVRQQNVNTAQRIALGDTLGLENEGLFVWDTQEKLPYVWTGLSWATTGGISAATWGLILGDISDQTDLMNIFDDVYDQIDTKVNQSTYDTFVASLADIAFSGDYADLLNVPINDPNGIAGLDGAGKIPLSLIPSSLLGAVIYQGGWNAATNTPALASGTGTKGHYYIVTTPGSTNLDGITDWLNGDWAIFDGTTWGKVDNTSTLVGSGSVNSITKWNATNSLTDSIITDDGTSVNVLGPASYDKFRVNGTITTYGSNAGLTVGKRDSIGIDASYVIYSQGPELNFYSVSEAAIVATFNANGELELPGYMDRPSASFGSVIIQSYTLNNAWISDNLYYDSSLGTPSWRVRDTGYGIALYMLDGSFGVYATEGTVSAGGTTTPRYNMRIANDGQVTLRSLGGGDIRHVYSDTVGNLGRSAVSEDSTSVYVNNKWLSILDPIPQLYFGANGNQNLIYEAGNTMNFRANNSVFSFQSWGGVNVGQLSNASLQLQYLAYGGDKMLYASGAGYIGATAMPTTLLSINNEVADYILALTDKDSVVEMDVVSANTVTVPPNSSVAFAIGTQILVTSIGVGQTTITPGVGVTIRAADGALKLRTQYSSCVLIKVATDTWQCDGDLTT